MRNPNGIRTESESLARARALRYGTPLHSWSPFACILTVGAHEQPTISRPDVAGDACQIEHLDFDHTPPCEADYDPPHPIGEAAATWILRVSSKCGHQLFSFALFCGDCKACYDRGRHWECLTCSGEFVLSWEPLR